jgi:hypothetical protein
MGRILRINLFLGKGVTIFVYKSSLASNYINNSYSY